MKSIENSIKYLTYYPEPKIKITKGFNSTQGKIRQNHFSLANVSDLINKKEKNNKKLYECGKINRVLNFLFLKKANFQNITICIKKYHEDLIKRQRSVIIGLQSKLKEIKNKARRVTFVNFENIKQETKLLDILMYYSNNINDEIKNRRENTTILYQTKFKKTNDFPKKLRKTSIQFSKNSNLFNLNTCTSQDRIKVMLLFLLDPYVFISIQKLVEENCIENTDFQKDPQENSKITTLNIKKINISEKESILDNQNIDKDQKYPRQMESFFSSNKGNVYSENYLQEKKEDRPITEQFKASHLFKMPEIPENFNEEESQQNARLRRLRMTNYHFKKDIKKKNK